MIITHQNVLYAEYIEYIVGWMKNGVTTALVIRTSLQREGQTICPELNIHQLHCVTAVCREDIIRTQL